MRKAPQYLTYFFIVIAVQRVAKYIADALHVSVMGWPFALGIAFGIYVGMYYQGTEKAKKAGKQAAWMFIIVDLIFNEFELIRELSAVQLVAPESNFLGMSQVQLEKGMQITAIIFGALPTLAIGFLGNLQSKADEHWKDKPTAFGRIGLAIQKMFSKFTVQIALRAEVFAKNIFPDAENKGTNLPKTAKGNLTSADIAFIVANNREAIMARFSVSDGTAGNWKAEFSGAKTAKKLTEGVTK